MYKFIFTLVFSFVVILCFAQSRIDSHLDFQNDPAKKYSIYIPSSYDASVPNKLMLGLHPLNTSRWDAVSWCDTLIVFAEANDLLLICPDGGADGAVDDPIDTAFTTLMLDNMVNWYNVDESQIYAMGFSWGGLTTYTYGLNHVDRFAGFMPIGAAINGVSPLLSTLNNANEKPFYIVHGSNDSPSSRFTPVRDALINAGACVETNLLSGVGHTIDFPNRNAILTTAFEWLESVACGATPLQNLEAAKDLNVFPNPIFSGEQLSVDWDSQTVTRLELYNIQGQLLLQNDIDKLLINKDLKGIYLLKIVGSNETFVEKIMIN